MSETEREMRLYVETGTLCHWCGGDCTGDVTEFVEIDGKVQEVAICDEPDSCPANQSA